MLSKKEIKTLIILLEQEIEECQKYVETKSELDDAMKYYCSIIDKLKKIEVKNDL